MPGSDGLRILGDFWKKAVSWDLKLDEASWDPNLGESSWVYEMRRAWWGSDGTVSIVKLCLFSPRVEKPKSQEGNKSFVPELPRVVSISGFLMYISYIHILVLFWWLCCSPIVLFLYNIMARGFRFMPLGLVRLRTFRFSTWVT